MKTCKYHGECRTQSVYGCPDDRVACDTRKEYDESGLAEEVYDARLHQIQDRLDREKTARHVIPNGSGEQPCGKGWRAT